MAESPWQGLVFSTTLEDFIVLYFSFLLRHVLCVFFNYVVHRIILVVMNWKSAGAVLNIVVVSVSALFTRMVKLKREVLCTLCASPAVNRKRPGGEVTWIT